MTRHDDRSGRQTSRGRGRGRGRGRFSTKLSCTPSTKYYEKELKFFLHGSSSDGRIAATFDTIKQNIIQNVQRTYKNGLDIAQSLKNETIIDLEAMKPARKISGATDTSTRQVQQECMDIEYKVAMGEHIK